MALLFPINQFFSLPVPVPIQQLKKIIKSRRDYGKFKKKAGSGSRF